MGQHRGTRGLWPVVGRVEQAAPHRTKSHDVEVRSADDPGAYSKPFKVTFTARFMPGEELMEYICQENEQDSKHIQGPAQNPNENNPLTGRTVR